MWKFNICQQNGIEFNQIHNILYMQVKVDDFSIVTLWNYVNV